MTQTEWTKYPEATVTLAEGEDLSDWTKAHRDERITVAEDSTTSPEVLLIMARANNWLVRQRVASNPSAPPGSLELLAKEDGDWRVRMAIANNPATPRKVLQMMAEKTERRDVLCDIATNPHTPLEVLIELAWNEYWPIRRWVATN